jgi:trimeric autotransporter adhesin
MRQLVVTASARALVTALAAITLAAAAGAIAPPARAQSTQTVPGDIYTIDGLATNSGLDGPAGQAAIGSPDDVLAEHGNTYIADGDGNRVLEVAGTDHTQWGIRMTKGDVYLIAGSPTGVPGASASGTLAAESKLDDPVGLALDNSGDLFIADSGNDRVMELTASARPWGSMAHPVADALYRVAGLGSGRARDGRDGEPATSSGLSGPAGVFIGGNAGGSLYIADAGNNRIQMIPRVSETSWGQRMTAYDVYTVAGSRAGRGGSSGDGGSATSARLQQPESVTIDRSGDLLIADTGNCRIQEVARAGGRQWGSISMMAGHIYTVAGRDGAACTGGHNGKRATASDLNSPTGVADSSGNLFIADTYSNVIKEVAGHTGRQYGQSMRAGRIYAIAGTGRAGLSGDGGHAATAELDSPAAVSVTGSGSVYIADTVSNQVREIGAAPPYDITTTAGDGFTLVNTGDDGPALDSALLNPDGVASDALGDLYVADAGNNRVQEIAASDHTQFGIAMTSGDTYTVAGSATGVTGASRNGVPATAALLEVPTSIAVDRSGDLYICDSENDRVIEVAATAHTQFGIRMRAGDVYTVAGVTGSGGSSGDGGPATSALLNLPTDVIVDAAGDLFIADTLNSRIQEVPATSGTQYGIAMTAGDVYTVAGSAAGAYGTSGDGGPGPAALLSNPFGIALDSSGNLYIADSGNNRVQELAASSGSQRGQSMQAGDIYTIAGSASGTAGNSGNGGPATAASLSEPADVAIDSAGDLYIADTDNNQIRELAATSGTQWNQSMTAGDIYTVAGLTDGAPGRATPGEPATSSALDLPIDVGLDHADDVIIPSVSTSSLLEVAAASSSPFPVYPQGASMEGGGVQSGSVQSGSVQSGSVQSNGIGERRATLRPGTVPTRHLATAAWRIYARLGLLISALTPAGVPGRAG